MIRFLTIAFLLLAFFTANAQYKGSFGVGWNILVPFSDKDFTGKTSTAGVRIGYSQAINDRFGFGVEAGYSTLNDYVPPTTYTYPGGAITADIYNYLYYFTLMANGQYYFAQSKKFLPYTSLGMGVALSKYKIFYNVYNEGDDNARFVIRPEVGTLFRVTEYSDFGLKVAIGFDYAANKSEYFATKNLVGLNFLIGIVLIGN